MKKSKLRGYIYDLEHKNKNFSFDKTIRILDISNMIYIDMIKNIEFREISDYKKSKYMFKEISEELEEVNYLLGKEKTLMAVCILRNVFEEIMYIIATSIETVDIDIMTKASYFYKIVADHCDELLYSYTSEDIKELYGYMSKITHVTNVKEAASYLVGNKQIKEATMTEIKEYFDNEYFNKSDIYNITRNTTKEDELFEYADIDEYYSKDDDFNL